MRLIAVVIALFAVATLAPEAYAGGGFSSFSSRPSSYSRPSTSFSSRSSFSSRPTYSVKTYGSYKTSSGAKVPVFRSLPVSTRLYSTRPASGDYVQIYHSGVLYWVLASQVMNQNQQDQVSVSFVLWCLAILVAFFALCAGGVWLYDRRTNSRYRYGY